MPDSFEVSAVLPADPQSVYQAWLDGEQHAAFTGGDAEVDGRVGGRFNVWEGYIEGITLELEPGRRIVQAWRTTEFPPGCPDSVLEVLLAKTRGGTRITLRHSRIPDGQGAEYRQGWKEHYFTPMKRYFSGKRGA
jgi:uncharacterized protein YndB with AHSA1/START domain